MTFVATFISVSEVYISNHPTLDNRIGIAVLPIQTTFRTALVGYGKIQAETFVTMLYAVYRLISLLSDFKFKNIQFNILSIDGLRCKRYRPEQMVES